MKLNSVCHFIGGTNGCCIWQI